MQRNNYTNKIGVIFVMVDVDTPINHSELMWNIFICAFLLLFEGWWGLEDFHYTRTIGNTTTTPTKLVFYL